MIFGLFILLGVYLFLYTADLHRQSRARHLRCEDQISSENRAMAFEVSELKAQAGKAQKAMAEARADPNGDELSAGFRRGQAVLDSAKAAVEAEEQYKLVTSASAVEQRVDICVAKTP